MKPKPLNKRYDIPYGKSYHIYKEKQINNNYIREIRVLAVKKDKQHPEGYRYSLVLIDRKTGNRLLGYDNFERKGHHKHILNIEIPYKFISIPKLFQDFEKDIKKFGDNKDENKENKDSN
ncbi:MAG: DUF6516 family protein [Candidatus Woesearchaeota archaeon]